MDQLTTLSNPVKAHPSGTLYILSLLSNVSACPGDQGPVIPGQAPAPSLAVVSSSPDSLNSR